MPDSDQISKLLRLKKYEQPGSEYFERFLRDFQRRQRSEMLRQPLWRIALDRADVFFGDWKRDVFGYGVAAAAAVVLFLGVVNFESGNQGAQQAATVAKPAATDTRTASNSSALQTRTEPTRYVIDTRPVSYHEPPFSF